MAVIASVSPTELIRSTWGNSVATELNTKAVKVDGTNPVITAPLIFNVAGPALRLRRSDNNPYFQFENTTGATRFGFIQGQATQMVYYADTATSKHVFQIGGSERLKIDVAGIEVTGKLTAGTGGVEVASGAVRIGGNGAQLKLIDTSTSGSDFHDTYIEFYGDGVSMVSPGTRSGFVGYSSSTTFVIVNQVANGGISLTGNGTGTVTLQSGSGGRINLAATNVDITSGSGNTVFNTGGLTIFQQSGAEVGRLSGSNFLWGKTAADSGGTTGVEQASSGRITSSIATPNTNLYLRHTGTAHADGVAYITFINSTGGTLSEITQDNVAPVGIKISACAVTAPSDYRLKNDLGPVVDAVARVLQLKPKHLSWIETGHEFDGFIAHEVAAVVPDAVTGEKDATYEGDEADRMGVEPGTIKPQGLDQIPLIPLLTAAVQELVERVAALEDL